MRVLVTGAAGWIGSAVRSTFGEQHELRLLDLRPPRDEADGEWIIGDLSDTATAVSAVAGVDAIIHLAAGAAGAGYQTPEPVMRNTVLGTVNLLDAAARSGIRRVVVMSSAAVVTGYPRRTFIDVDLPRKFVGSYSLAKALQELIAQQYAEEYHMVIPTLRPWSVVDGRTYRWANGEPLRKNVDPDAHDGFFGLLCRWDLAEACALALTAELGGFELFHVMATSAGMRWFDVKRTTRLLGWQPRTTFADLDPELGIEGAPER